MRFISSALPSPTRRGRRCVPPKPGMIPRLISGWPNVADSAARRKSQAIDSSHPPPNAMLLTAAIVVVLDVSISRSIAWPESSRPAPPEASIFVNSLMSAPAENVKMLLDAITTERICESLVAVLPQLAELRDHLRAERVRGRPVQPDDRDLAARLEQHGLLLVEVGVRLRIGEEALAGLLAEPALRDEAAQDRRGREALAPLAPRRARARRASRRARARRRARTARAGSRRRSSCRSRSRAGSRRPPRARGTPRRTPSA